MNINDTSLLTSILVSFLLLVVEAPLAGCLPALCQETSVIFLPILFTQWLFFFFFASISRVWNDNEGEKKKKMGQQMPKHCPGVQWRVMDLGAVWSLLWGSSRWIDSLVTHFSGGKQKKSSWMKTGMSLVSLGGFAGILCCLMHSWRWGRK